MGKQPPLKATPSKAPFLRDGGKQTDSAPDDFPTAFSFEKMQDDSGHSINCCGNEDRVNLIKRMFMLSKMPWKEIRNASSKGFGAEQIPKYRVKKTVPSSVTEDVDAFTSLHYSGKRRFIGYRVGRIFYILWVDYNFKVYDHG